MEDIRLKIDEIEREIRETPYHKGTERHIGRLRARLARLLDETTRDTGGSGGGVGYAVKKTGDASVVFVGPPSVGKSTLLNALTNAQSKVGAYDFTTLNVVPGMLEYKGTKIQLFDIPGIIQGASSGKGRGKQVLSVARSADMVVIMVDPATIDKMNTIENELEEAGFRLNMRRPRVAVKKMTSGGIVVKGVSGLAFGTETVKALAEEFRLANGEIIIHDSVTIDEMIDVFIGNRRYIPAINIVNKADIVTTRIEGFLYISARDNTGLETLREEIWQKLKLIRIYLKKEAVDYQEPFVVHLGMNLTQIIELLHLSEDRVYRKARINGPGARFPNQEVSLTFIPQDETVVQFLS